MLYNKTIRFSGSFLAVILYIVLSFFILTTSLTPVGSFFFSDRYAKKVESVQTDHTVNVHDTRALQPDVLYYSFEDGGGNTVTDMSAGGGNDGTLQGTSFTNDAKYGSYALSCPAGNQNHLSVGGNINNLHMQSAYTFMCWFKGSQPGRKGAMMFGDCCTNRNGYTMNVYANEIRFWGGSDVNNNNYNTYANNINVYDNNWHHIAIRCNNVNLQIIVDGIVRTANGQPNVPTSPGAAQGSHCDTDPSLGGDPISGNNEVHALIDEAAVFSRYLSNQEIQEAMEGLRPVPVPENVVAEDTDNGTCYAQYRPYRIKLNVTSPRELNDIAEVQMYLDYNTTNSTLCYNWTRDEFFELQDEDGHVDLITNMCDVTNNGIDKWWLNFTIMINFSFPHEDWVDCYVNLTANDGEVFSKRFPWLFHVENDLDFSGVPTYTAEYQGVLDSGYWVRGNETIIITGPIVHYQGVPDIYPADDLYDVRLTDQGGGVWWDNMSHGEEVWIEIQSRDVVDENELLYITIVNIPEEGFCITNFSFSLKIDSSPPLPPASISTHAYGKTSPFTKDPSINLSWQEVPDNASGLLGYYYSKSNNSYTDNGTYTDLTEGEVRGLHEGRNELFVWCEDNVGNIGSARSVNILVDLTGPSFSNFTPSSVIWQNLTTLDCSVEIQDLTGTGVDGGSVFYSISTAGPNTFSSWVPVWVPDGGERITVEAKCKFEEGTDNYIKWRAMDAAENDFTESEPHNIMIDVSPVEFSEKIEPQKIWFDTTHITSTVSVMDEGGSGVDTETLQVRFSRDGEASFSPWLPIAPKNVSQTRGDQVILSATFEYEEGSGNLIQFRGTDVSGNSMVYSKKFGIQIDMTPVAFSDFEVFEKEDPEDVECGIFIWDDHSGVDLNSIEYSVSTDGDDNDTFGDWDKVEPHFIFPGYPVRIDCDVELDWGRDNYVRFRADDVMGSGEIISDIYRVNITSEPRAVITLPAEKRQEYNVSDIILFDGSSSWDRDGDDLSFYWESNISGGIGLNSTIEINLSKGNHTITLYVSDADGNNRTDRVLVDIKGLSGEGGKTGDDDDDTGGGIADAGGGGGICWWWIIVLIAVLLLLFLILLLVIRRRKKREEEEEKQRLLAERQRRLQTQAARRAYTPPAGPAVGTYVQPGTQSYPPASGVRYNVQFQRPVPPAPTPGYVSNAPSLPAPPVQRPALPQYFPAPVPAASRAQDELLKALPSPPDAPEAPQYQLPTFSTDEGEQDLNLMALPPAPDDSVGSEDVKDAPDLQEKYIPPAPGSPPPSTEDKVEEKKYIEGEKKDRDISIDSVFGVLDSLVSEPRDLPSPEEDRLPAPSISPEEPTPPADLPSLPTPHDASSGLAADGLEPREISLQCHSCGREYPSLVTDLPAIVTCIYCGEKGQIGSL